MEVINIPLGPSVTFVGCLSCNVGCLSCSEILGKFGEYKFNIKGVFNQVMPTIAYNKHR